MADSNYNSNNNRNNSSWNGDSTSMTGRNSNTYGQGNSDVRMGQPRFGNDRNSDLTYGQDQGYNEYQKRADSNSDSSNDRDYSRDYNRDYNRDSQREGSRTSNMGMGRSGADNQASGYGTNYGTSRSTSYGSGMDRSRSYGSSELANSAFGSTNSGTFGSSNSGTSGSSNTSFGSSMTGRHAGKGPKGYQRSDDRIKEDVSEELYHHHEIDASQLEVDVKEGIVTLKGHVETRAIKRLAEDSIQHLSGVKDVRNELSVDQSLFQQAKEYFTGESDMSKFPAKTDSTAKTGSKH